MRKTKFTNREWYFTTANESLFDLDKDQLALYRLIIKEAA
jgi:hypothetical protein